MINQELYDNLMTLCNTNEAFFFKDFPISTGGCYRIFNYRLATYTDFMLPSALECRGIMFELDKDGNALRVASRPMEKFFNDGENPSTMNVDYSFAVQIMFKEDGSLISTYVDDRGQLKLKTKGSLSSEQAIDAMNWLDNTPFNTDFKNTLHEYACANYTVNMEWVAPFNRIVLQYVKPALVVLNVRHNVTGEYMDQDSWDANLKEFAVHDYMPWEDADCLPTPDQFVDFIRAREGFEGVVVRLNSGQHVKIKTKWYSILHAAKDSIDNPKALIATVLSEGLDDLRSLFVDNPDALARMDRYEEHVSHKFNHIVAMLNGCKDNIEDVFNSAYSRKDYAIAAKEYWANCPEFFGVQMNMLVRPEQSVEQSVKDVMLKNYKDYVLPSDLKLVNEE